MTIFTVLPAQTVGVAVVALKYGLGAMVVTVKKALGEVQPCGLNAVTVYLVDADGVKLTIAPAAVEVALVTMFTPYHE
jgi:hypothetical protein